MAIRIAVRITFILGAALALGACSEQGQTSKAQTADTAKTGAPASQSEADAAAAQVLEAYRVGGMLDQAAPIINDALKSNLPAAVNEQERQRLAELVEKTFARDALLARTRDHMKQAAAQADAGEKYLHTAADVLQQDLAQRMIKLDDAAASDEFAQGFAAFSKETPPDDASQRMQRVRTLADSMRLEQLQVAYNIGMMKGMLAARNAASPEAYSVSDENAQKMVEQTRAGLEEHLTEQVPMMMYFAYRDVDDDTLAEYASQQDSEALRWTNAALVDALRAALEAAAASMPEQFASDSADKQAA